MFHKVLAWYRGLSKGWKYVAWIVVVVVAVVSVVVFALPWVLSSRLRDQVKVLKADAALGKARGQIDAARAEVADLKGDRDKALASERVHAAEEIKVDGRIAQIDEKLDKDQAKVKEQTHDDQADWFSKRYPR